MLLRRSSVIRAIFVVAFCLSSAMGVALGQEEGKTSNRVDLGVDKSNPGGQGFIPVILSSDDRVSMGTIVAEIRFSNKELVFQEVKKGPSANSTDIAIFTAVKSDKDSADHSILELKFENTAGQPLAAGVLANIVFKILDEVPANRIIPLESRASAATTGAPSETISLGTSSGQIEMKDIPLAFSCLFYMH